MAAPAALSTIGLIGFGVMGQNLALNIAEKGFAISGYNRTAEKVTEALARARENGISNLHGFTDLKAFVNSIAKPRSILIMVTAGNAVDAVLESLVPLLENHDLIIDCGNEWYENTERRAKYLATKGLLYMGMGVSGGDEGARHGPSLMPGGPREAYDRVAPILSRIAAQVSDGPCVTYIGPGGSGNYVKMVHNGIEYGDMQLIAEAYDILHCVVGLNNSELAQIFASWNAPDSELRSFLIEITSYIFTVKSQSCPELKDAKEPYVVDAIVDKTGSKGTGMWAVQEAAKQLVPAPTICAALDMRYLSSVLDERLAASRILSGPSPAAASLSSAEKHNLIQSVRAALYISKICSYAQGMALLQQASKNNNWNLDLASTARIWKGGCIIRAVFLDQVQSAFTTNPHLVNLLVDPFFATQVNRAQANLRHVIKLSLDAGVPTLAFSSSLAYLDGYRSVRLPANLTQAQRDLFGSHTVNVFGLQPMIHINWNYARL